jgi:uncharacterized membrane protein
MTHNHQGRRHGKQLAVIGLATMLGSIVLLWSWNTVAVDLLGLKPMMFKHALAIQLLFLSTAFVLLLPRKLSGQNAQ